jgi:hypothetical protein
MLRIPGWVGTAGYQRALSFLCRGLLALYYIYAAHKFYQVVLAYTGLRLLGWLLGVLIALVIALAAFDALNCELHPYLSDAYVWLMKLPAAYLYAKTLHVAEPWICAGILLAGDIAATILAMSMRSERDEPAAASKGMSRAIEPSPPTFSAEAKPGEAPRGAPHKGEPVEPPVAKKTVSKEHKKKKEPVSESVSSTGKPKVGGTGKGSIGKGHKEQTPSGLRPAR